MNHHFVRFCLAVAIPLCACTTEGYYKESNPELIIDEKIIVAGADPVTDTLPVTSNRSWSVVRTGDEEWLSFDVDEHLNLSGAKETSSIVFSLDANVLKQDRSTSFKVVGEEGALTVVVTQKAIVYRLSVDGPRSFVDVPDTGDTLRVNILTNTQWKAEVGEGSTASIELPETIGEGNSELMILVGKNADRTEGKTATVIVRVEDCEPVEILVEQVRSVPFVRHEVPDASGLWVDPTVFSAICSERSFKVLSNCKWTAKVDAAGTTAKDVELPVDSGEGNNDDFRVIVRGTNTDMDNPKTVSIVFTPEEGEPYTVNMTQSKGSVIALEFRTQDLSAARWVFDEDQPGAVAQDGALTAGGYEFKYHAEGYCQLHDASGWQLGTGTTVFVEFPAIPGRKLVRVSFREYNKNTKPQIVTSGGSVVSGGEAISFDRNVLTSYYLSGTQENTPYRMQPTEPKTFRFTFIELEYKQ